MLIKGGPESGSCLKSEKRNYDRNNSTFTASDSSKSEFIDPERVSLKAKSKCKKSMTVCGLFSSSEFWMVYVIVSVLCLLSCVAAEDLTLYHHGPNQRVCSHQHPKPHEVGHNFQFD